MLQLFLSSNSIIHRLKLFKINKPVYIIFCSKRIGINF